jgi:hypothetical protein|tara:strand:- start:428 stop:772 length:345 start_codon:yes stop_codon:yes gene_type:complete
MEISRHFSWEGFCHINILEALNETGFSKTEAKRLFKDGAIKVWDTKVTNDGCHFVWFKRIAELVELVEPKDVILVGRNKSLTIQAIPFKCYEKALFKLRLLKEQLQDRRRNAKY